MQVSIVMAILFTHLCVIYMLIAQFPDSYPAALSVPVVIPVLAIEELQKMFSYRLETIHTSEARGGLILDVDDAPSV